MINVLLLGTASYVWDTERFVDISLAVSAGPSVNAFHLPPALFEPFRMGSFVGSVEEGGPCRCDVVTVAPHGNGTHTECVGHVAGAAYRLPDCLNDVIVPARLVTVTLKEDGSGDRLVTREELEKVWHGEGESALVIRTNPNDGNKRTARYSGANPAYVHIDAMRLMVERGVKHLLIDLPSVDREEDGGALAAHKLFWNWPDVPRVNNTITELIYVPDTVEDGRYLVAFNAAAFDGDAAPSRPVLFPLTAA